MWILKKSENNDKKTKMMEIKVCSLKKRKTAKDYQVETSFKYLFCEVPMCKMGFGFIS